MANASTAFGFKHIGRTSGAPPTFEMSVRAIQSTYASIIGFGDVVTKISSTSPYIGVATNASVTSGPIEGVFIGCQYTPTSGGGVTWSKYWPGNAGASDAVAYIVDDPDAQFLVATLNTAITSANLGQTVNFTTGSINSGTTVLPAGISVMVVDQSTLSNAGGTAASPLPFKVVGLYGPYFGNFGTANYPGQFGGQGNGADPTTAYNWVVVSFNNQIRNTLAGW
jgi:hypothetical protein